MAVADRPVLSTGHLMENLTKRGPDWERVIEAASWQPRDSQGEVAIRSSCGETGCGSWGGPRTYFYEDNDETLKNDVWSSADGKQWRLETADAGWSKRRWPADMPIPSTARSGPWSFHRRGAAKVGRLQRLHQKTDRRRRAVGQRVHASELGTRAQAARRPGSRLA